MKLYQTENQLNDFLKWMPSICDEVIALDTETYSIRPGHPQGGLLPSVSRIRLIQLATEETVYVLDLLCLSDAEYKVYLDKFTSRLGNLTLVGHNSSFDMKHLLHHTPLTQFNMFCTQTMFYILISALDGNPHAYKADLASLMWYFFEEKMSKDLQKSDWSAPELTKEQIEYACDDVRGTRRLYFALQEKLAELDLLEIVELEDALRPVLVRMSVKGFHIDTELHDKLSAEWKERTEIAEKECINFLNAELPYSNEEAMYTLLFNKVKTPDGLLMRRMSDLWIPDNGYECLWLSEELFKRAEEIITEADIKKFRALKKADPTNEALVGVKERTAERTALRRIAKNIDDLLITPSKTSRLGSWLEERITPEELAEWPRTDKTKELSINKEAFEQFSYLPFVQPIAAYSDMAKLHSTYGEGMKRFIVDGKVNSSYKQGYATTGRLSSSEPNGQNFPGKGTGKELRRVFIASGEDRALLRADYSQIEARIMGLVSGDQNILNIYEQGLDIHTATAMSMTGKKNIEDITPEERTAAKICVFGLAYGAGAESLKRYAWILFKVEWTLVQAKSYVDKFREAYPTYRQYQVDITNEVEQSLTLTSPLGKIVTFPADDFFCKAINFKIQSAAGEVMKLALIYMDREITLMPVESGNAYLVTTVHDEVIVDSSVEFAERNAEVIERCMKQAMLDVFPNACLNNLVEVTVGRNWLEAK